LQVEAKRSNNNLVDIEQEILNFNMDQQQQGEKNPNSLRTPEPKSSMSGSVSKQFSSLIATIFH